MKDDDDLRALWQQQENEPMNVTVEDIANQAAGFQKTVKRRNVAEYLAGALVAVVMGSVAIDPSSPLAARIGALLLAMGVVVVTTHIRLRGHAAEEEPKSTAKTAEVVAFHRVELTRQRDFLRRVPTWYVLPLVPGMATIYIGAMLRGGWRAAPALGLGILVIASVLWLNARAARKLDDQIRSLNE